MKYILLPVLLALTACGNQPPAPTEYLLRSDLERHSRELRPSRLYRFGDLRVADYIDRPGLVLETGAGVIHQAVNHLWAEPLRSSLRLFLATEISALVGEDIFFEVGGDTPITIDIMIDQLHGTAEGEAMLAAYWRLTATDGERRSFQFVASRPLQEDGYRALADAEKALLQSLAREIAGTLAAE